MQLACILLICIYLNFTLALLTTKPPIDPFKNDIKMETKAPKNNNETKGILKLNYHQQVNLSTAAESVITFVSVFVVGCVITLSVYSWKKFKPSHLR